MIASLIALLIALAVFCVLMVVVFWVVKQMELVQPIRSVVLGLVGLIMLLLLLSYFNKNGWFDSSGGHHVVEGL